MKVEFNINETEKSYLRELARKYLEYAHLPVMEERRKLWYQHNALGADRPMVVMEMVTFEQDMLPEPRCQSAAAREIEMQLQRGIINYEMINDDKVISPYYTVNWNIGCQMFGMDIAREHSTDSKGRAVGYTQKHPISDLTKDFHLLKPSKFIVDRQRTLDRKTFAEDVIGDILPVKIKNSSLEWHAAPTAKIIDLMGLETMMYSMMDYPEEMHKLMNFVKDDILAFVRWQEKEGLLTLNNENDYVGAGSYGFTDELPSEQYHKTGVVTSKDLWLNMNSQESVGISPLMYEEFIYPYYQELAEEFGLVYYGCCEPVHTIWDSCISELPGLRKVSISPWCNEDFMGEKLKDTKVIYSRKPSPNFIGVGEKLDENAFSKHIAKTLKAAQGCHVEIIFRDVYTLSGDKSKPGRAVEITRAQIEKLW